MCPSTKEFKKVLGLIEFFDEEIEKCRRANAYFAGTVMIGAAIEAILLAMTYTLSDEELKNIISKVKEKFKKELSCDRKKWALDDLIKIAITCGWIPYKGAEDPDEGALGDWLLNYVKEIRNFIHPGKWLNKDS